MAERVYLSDYPELMAEWDYERNVGLDPGQIRRGSNKKVWWVCKRNRCGCHRWSIAPCKRTDKKLPSGCPYCCNILVCRHSSLLEQYPDLCEEWNYTKNTIDPSTVSPHSRRRVWWICRNNICGCHEWDSKIRDRTKKNSTGCPFCAGKKVCSHSSLFATQPKLCEEWDYQKNTFLPTDITQGSSKKVWWVCKINRCGCHCWTTTPLQRTYQIGRSGTNCPYCSGRKICEHTSLLTLYKLICNDWDYQKNNIDPSKISPGSEEKTWWICSANNIHKWQCAIRSRTYGEAGCPHCNNSRGERLIASILSNRSIIFLLEATFPDCLYINRLKFDFHIPSLKLLIEFDGEQHFDPDSYYSKKGNFEQSKERDLIKTRYARDNNFSLIRISYDRCDDILQILTGVLNGLTPNTLFITMSEDSLVTAIYETHKDGWTSISMI